MTRSPTRMSRWNLWLLVVVSAAPVVFAWFYILNPDRLPDTRANRGELIEPVIPVGAMRLDGPQGAFALSEFRGRWVLLLHAEVCGEECLSALWAMRQVRLALGSDRGRVTRLLLLEERGAQLPDRLMRGVVLASPTMEGDEIAHLSTGSVHVVDPYGSLVMRYTPPVRADELLNDMERLLRVSEHWGNDG